MDHSKPWNLGALEVERIWLLNSTLRHGKDFPVINCIALAVKTPDFFLLMHSLREPEFYDPFSNECSLHLWSPDSGDFSKIEAKFQEFGVIGDLKWLERPGAGLRLDLNKALKSLGRDQIPLALPGTIEVYTSSDTLQLTGHVNDMTSLAGR